METYERKIAGKMMRIAVCLFFAFLLGCGEWEGGAVGKVSCSFGTFNDFLPVGRRPVKMASGNNGNNIYILDESYYVHTYKRDNLYECEFNLEYSDYFTGLPKDVISNGSTFYVQDGARLKSWDDVEVCDARDGFFAISGNELAVGSNFGIETWNINSCAKTTPVSSQKVLALAATDNEYYAAEDLNLTRYPKNGTPYRSPAISDFCSIDRIIANNFGVYLLDKKCRKIGVYEHQPILRRTISLDSLGVRGALDIASADYQYIFILHERGVEKISTLPP